MVQVSNGKATGTLAEILGYAFAASLVGLKADPVDVTDVALTWSGTAWSGKGGRFALLASVTALPKTWVASGVIFEVGTAKYTWNGSALVQTTERVGAYAPGVLVGEPGSPANPFSDTTARNAAFTSQLPGYVGFPAYLPGGVRTEWVGPTNIQWKTISINLAPSGRMFPTGDSLTQYYNGGVCRMSSFLGGGKWWVAEHFGIAGQSMEQVAGRLDSDISGSTAKSGDWVRFQAGTNNALGLAGVMTISVLRNTLDIVAATANKYSMRLIYSTIPPNLANANNVEIVNTEIRAAAIRNSAILVDPFVTVRTALGAYVSGMSGDNIHLSKSGIYAAGKEEASQFSTALGPLKNPFTPLSGVAGEGVATDPLIQATATGGLAASLNLIGTPTPTVVALSPASSGNKQVATVSAQTGTHGVFPQSSGANKFACLTNHRYALTAEVSISANSDYEMWAIGNSSVGFFGTGSLFTPSEDATGVLVYEIKTGNNSNNPGPMIAFQGGPFTGACSMAKVQYVDLTALGLSP